MNTDKVVNYILKNASKLSAEKINSLSNVVKALGQEIDKEPNTVPETDENDQELMENQPVDMSEITGVQIDDGPKKKIKVYSQK